MEYATASHQVGLLVNEPSATAAARSLVIANLRFKSSPPVRGSVTRAATHAFSYRHYRTRPGIRNEFSRAKRHAQAIFSENAYSRLGETWLHAGVRLDTADLLFRRFLGPRIAERGSAVEDGLPRFRIDGVGEEVA